MKTVLLVDDEFPARQLVKAMLNWDEAGFEIAYEAKNGAEALAIYHAHKPDLIISDIQMPMMDGLEFLSTIRKKDDNQLFVILSCFERFDYARQVVQLGALDYLIKDTLTADVLYTVLQNAAAALERRPPTTLAFAKKGHTHRPCDISIALQGWVDGGSAQQAKKQIEMALAEPAAPFIIASVALELTENADSGEVILEALEGLDGFCEHCGCCWETDSQLLIFGSIPKVEELEMRRERYALLRQWKDALECISGGKATVGVSADHHRLEELVAACQESRDTLMYRMFMSTGHILYYTSVQNASHTVQHHQLEVRIKNLRAALAENETDKVSVELNQLYQQNLHGVIHLNYLENLNVILWGVLAEEQLLRSFQENVPPLDGKALKEICAMDSVEAMRDDFSRRFALLMKKGSRQTDAQYSQRVRHIRHYVADNLDKDIGLDSIAEEFQLHKAHLARVFKEEMGLGLGEYIRCQRIEKAKTLLMSSQHRVNEIIYMVGFNSPQNFYSLFMRYVGMTPKAYRDQHG